MKNKEKNTSDNKFKNRFLSEGELSEQEFLMGIQSAEKGPFYTVLESMKQFEDWLKEGKEG